MQAFNTFYPRGAETRTPAEEEIWQKLRENRP